MISFEHRVLSEYRIKIAKIETLVKSILTHRDPKSIEALEASDFLDVLITETDRFYSIMKRIRAEGPKNNLNLK
jgi:hypothetical protein